MGKFARIVRAPVVAKSRFSTTEIACVGHPRHDEGFFKNRFLRLRLRCAPALNPGLSQ
jgi:hypothetical protein